MRRFHEVVEESLEKFNEGLYVLERIPGVIEGDFMNPGAGGSNRCEARDQVQIDESQNNPGCPTGGGRRGEAGRKEGGGAGLQAAERTCSLTTGNSPSCSRTRESETDLSLTEFNSEGV